MKTTTDLINDLRLYLTEKYQTETPENKEKIFEFLHGLNYINQVVEIFDAFLISFNQVLSLRK